MTMDVTVDDFRGFFPEFSDVADDVIESYISQAEIYLSPESSVILPEGKLKLAICLFAAHLIITAKAAGLTPQQLASGSLGVVTSKTVGNVSVGQSAPPFIDGLSYWLYQTPYGVRLLALLDSMLAVPTLINGEFMRFL